MKKVINITLSGIVFACENDAYNALASYLESITQKYSGGDDHAEILLDIESAIAEKFSRAKKNEKFAVTLSDVENVIAEMGNVSQIDEGNTTNTNEEKVSAGKGIKKKLFRTKEDSVLGGVAGGIAAYFDIDPVIVRILFFASVFLNGIGIIVYILLWFIVPEAETTSDKFAMRGEKMTISHITENVKTKISDIDTGEIKNNAKKTWGGVRPLIVKFFTFLGMLVKLIFHSLRTIIGVILIIVGGIATASIVAGTIVVTSGKNLFSIDPFAQEFISYFFTSSVDGLLLLIGTALILIIPILAIIITGASLVRGKNAFTVGNSVTLFLVWLLSIILVSFIGATFSGPQNSIQISSVTNSESACTLEARMCPDGTLIGRQGPQCEFAECPEPHTTEIVDLISAESPLAGSFITSPVNITGEARGTWFFEATFPISIIDSRGAVLGEGFATADGDWMTEEYVPYSATIDFTPPEANTSKRGTVLLEKSNPSGLPENSNLLPVPIQF